MSVCVQYPSAGCIVEYLEGNAIQIALVTEESGGKLRLLLPNRRETRLTTSRLLPWARAGLRARQGRVRPRAGAAPRPPRRTGRGPARAGTVGNEPGRGAGSLGPVVRRTGRSGRGRRQRRRLRAGPAGLQEPLPLPASRLPDLFRRDGGKAPQGTAGTRRPRGPGAGRQQLFPPALGRGLQKTRAAAPARRGHPGHLRMAGPRSGRTSEADPVRPHGRPREPGIRRTVAHALQGPARRAAPARTAAHGLGTGARPLQFLV